MSSTARKLILYVENNQLYTHFSVIMATTAGPHSGTGQFPIDQRAVVTAEVYAGQQEPNPYTGHIDIPEGIWSGMIQWRLHRANEADAIVLASPDRYNAGWTYALDASRVPDAVGKGAVAGLVREARIGTAGPLPAPPSEPSPQPAPPAGSPVDLPPAGSPGPVDLPPPNQGGESSTAKAGIGFAGVLAAIGLLWALGKRS